MKIPKQAYTTEFKELAVKRVKDGQTAGAVAKELGLIEQTLRNWVNASADGRLQGAGATDALALKSPKRPKLNRRDGNIKRSTVAMKGFSTRSYIRASQCWKPLIAVRDKKIFP